jgi:UPF0271 protein
MSSIDLNCDLGEGFGDDRALLRVVSSANVACGYHAGDAGTMRESCELAVAGGVAIGAQVSYLDREGFGRRFLEVDPTVLRDQVIHQIGALDGFARVAGARVRYVKPHGALYNAIVHHGEQAAAVVDAVRAYDPALAVLGLPGSEVLTRARGAGLPTIREAFADRAYNPDGTLVSRGSAGAVLEDPGEIAARCVAIATGRPVTDVAGGRLWIEAESLCVHGDTAGAAAIAQRVRAALEAAGVGIAPFTDDGAQP